MGLTCGLGSIISHMVIDMDEIMRSPVEFVRRIGRPKAAT